MSGEANYGGNGSVYWSVGHQNGGRLEVRDGNYGWDRAGNPGNPTMTRKPWSPALDQGQWMDVAGLHPGGVTGRDHRPSQEFEVQLRFDLSPDGIAAPTAQRRAAVAGILQKLIDDAQAALGDVNAGAASTVITVHVPVVNRPQPPVNDFEVVVRWR